MKSQDEKYMNIAINEAKKAFDKEEVPIGAIIVRDGKVISRAHNLRESKKNAIAHAEILAIEKACKKLDSWRLSGCEMYVTCEPCPMCAGAILNSRIKRVVFGARDEKSGAVVSKLRMFDNELCNHQVQFQEAVNEDECEQLIKDFFKGLRSKSK